MKYSEVKTPDSERLVPLPLFINIMNRIKEKKSPHYDAVKYILDDMEIHLIKSGLPVTIYAINPRLLEKEIEQKIESEKKLSVRGVSYLARSFLSYSPLKKDKDYWVSTTSGGKTNYHVKVDSNVLGILRTTFL